MEDSPIVPVSSLSGQGLTELKDLLSRTLKSTDKSVPSGYFRLPVDRAFVMQGHGVVVTGTALSGEIKTGDHVRCLPGGELFRVRSLQVHGRSMDTAGWGQRGALNLSGPERASIERGHVICHEKLTLTSDRFDAFLEVRPAAAKGIKIHQRIRVHLGTAERLAKIILLSTKDKVGPKESTYFQLTLRAVSALRNDHFIVRRRRGKPRRRYRGSIPGPGSTNAQSRTAKPFESLHAGNATRSSRAFLTKAVTLLCP